MQDGVTDTKRGRFSASLVTGVLLLQKEVLQCVGSFVSKRGVGMEEMNIFVRCDNDVVHWLFRNQWVRCDVAYPRRIGDPIHGIDDGA